MGQQVEIGGITFKTKQAAENHVRDILNRHSPMQELRGEDLKFAVALLDKHQNYDAIVDCGVKRICVQHLDDKYSARRFVVVRADGSMRDWSWRNAINPRDARHRLMRACRYAVKDQIKAFASMQWAQSDILTCPISNAPVNKLDYAVHHVPPKTFEALVERWLKAGNITPEDVQFVPQVGYEIPDRWEDDFLKVDWQVYHRTMAHLELVDGSAHRSLKLKAGHSDAS